MDDKYNEAIDLYMAGRYSEAIEAMAQSKTVAPDVYQQFVQQCRNLSPQSEEIKQSSQDSSSPEEASTPREHISHRIKGNSRVNLRDKGTLLNAAIVLLIAANLTVGILWIKNCLFPSTVRERDFAITEKLISYDDLATRADSMSYALGCSLGSSNNLPDDEELRKNFYSGVYHGLATPLSENRRKDIDLIFQHMILPDLQKRSKVGELDGDIYFQGMVDAGSTSGQNKLISSDEAQTIILDSF